jgi:hypothetical protein
MSDEPAQNGKPQKTTDEVSSDASDAAASTATDAGASDPTDAAAAEVTETDSSVASTQQTVAVYTDASQSNLVVSTQLLLEV